MSPAEALKRAEEVKQLTSFKYQAARYQLYHDVLVEAANGNWNVDVLARIALTVEKPTKDTVDLHPVPTEQETKEQIGRYTTT